MFDWRRPRSRWPRSTTPPDAAGVGYPRRRLRAMTKPTARITRPTTRNVIHIDPLPEDVDVWLDDSLAATAEGLTSVDVVVVISDDGADDGAGDGVPEFSDASAMSTAGEHSVAG